MTWPSYITHKLYDTDGVTEITYVDPVLGTINALYRGWGGKGSDQYSDAGFASVNIDIADTGASLVASGQIVQVLTNGVEMFQFKIEGNPEYKQRGEGEELEQFLVASGRGAGAAAFDEPVIQPEPLLVGVDLDTSWRHWTFASINFPNAAGWNPAVERYEYKDGVSYGARVDSQLDPGADPDDPADDVVKLYSAPMGFPWPNAPKNGNGFAPTAVYDPVYYVTADGAPSEESIGFHFFIGSFSLAGEQQVEFHATGDNLWKYFLNGVPIMEEQENTLGWKDYKQIALELPAGSHVLGFVVENVDADVDYNPAGALYDAIASAVYPGDVETSLTLSLFTSGATDIVRSFFSTGIWPGWAAGQILQDIIDEVTARGAMTQYVANTFGALVDSDSNSWDNLDPDASSPYIPTWSQKVGDSLLDMLNDLHEAGYIDWHFDPDSITLNVWQAGLAGSSPAVDFELSTATFTGNIVSLERGEEKPYANALLVQWQNGWTWVDDAAEITAYGSRVEDVFSPDALPASIPDATRAGLYEISTRKGATKVPVLITLEPRNQNEAPYEGLWTVGDRIDIPNKLGEADLGVQTLAIEWDQGEDGYATWKVEMKARWRSPEKEWVRLLRHLGGKTLGAAGTQGQAKF